MANGDLESFRCPAETLQCAAKRIDFTFMEVLQHALYHIIFEIFKSEKEAYKDGLNEILDDNVIEAGVDKLEIREMDSSLVRIGLDMINDKNLADFMDRNENAWKTLIKREVQKPVQGRCEICDKTFMANGQTELKKNLEKHRFFKHFDKIIEHTFHKRRNEPDAKEKTYCGVKRCGKNVGGNQEWSGQKILIHHKLYHPEEVTRDPFVPLPM